MPWVELVRPCLKPLRAYGGLPTTTHSLAATYILVCDQLGVRAVELWFYSRKEIPSISGGAKVQEKPTVQETGTSSHQRRACGRKSSDQSASGFPLGPATFYHKGSVIPAPQKFFFHDVSVSQRNCYFNSEYKSCPTVLFSKQKMSSRYRNACYFSYSGQLTLGKQEPTVPLRQGLFLTAVVPDTGFIAQGNGQNPFL